MALIVVTMSHATFALIVADKIVIDAPPIARFTVGWSARRAWDYYSNRPARVEWVPEPTK